MKSKITLGDTVVFEGKQGIVEAFHKKQAVGYLIEEQERELIYLNNLSLCEDKWEEMVK